MSTLGTGTNVRLKVASDPYPWPFVGDVAGERIAVLLAGVQPWSIALCADPETSLARALAVAERARQAGAKIVWTEHALQEGALPGRRASLLPARRSPVAHLAVTPTDSDIVVEAGGFDGFHDSRLDTILHAHRRSMLVLAGVGLETVIHSTMRSANDRGYECLTLSDASAAWDVELAPAAISSICMSGGIFGAVARSEALVDAFNAAG